VHALETEEANILARLDGLRKGKAKKVCAPLFCLGKYVGWMDTDWHCGQVTASEREKIEKEWKKSVMVCRKREKIAREMWRMIADMLPDKDARDEHREMFDLDG
jgi:26S proteasome regulatory subunit (ATPase 3-interacting protein)